MKSSTNLSIWVMLSYLIGFPLMLALPWPSAMVQSVGVELGSVVGFLLWISFLVYTPRRAVQMMRPAVGSDLYLVPFPYSRYCCYYKRKSGHSKCKREGYVVYSSWLFHLFNDNSVCAILYWFSLDLLGMGVDVSLYVARVVLNFFVLNVVVIPHIFVWLCYKTIKDWLLLVLFELLFHVLKCVDLALYAMFVLVFILSNELGGLSSEPASVVVQCNLRGGGKRCRNNVSDNNKRPSKSCKRSHKSKSPQKVKEANQRYWDKHKDERNVKRREQYPDHSDEANAKRREQYPDHSDEANAKRREQYPEHRNKANAKRRDKRKRERENVPKADFDTRVHDLPLDTTRYDFEHSPENAVMNWYMLASDGWRYEWDYETYQENIDSADTETQNYARERLEKLLSTIEAQKITPERQKRLASRFYEALGRGCPWGTHANFDDDQHGPSQDAWLLGCACCGFRDYCIENAYRTYHTR